jgi:hypothetical protein
MLKEDELTKHERNAQVSKATATYSTTLRHEELSLTYMIKVANS